MNYKLLSSVAIAAITSLLIAGCGSSGSSGDGMGRISLGISDGPMHDATKVCIRFDEIELKGEGPSTTIALDPAETVNLLEFQGMNAAPILSAYETPAGNYPWIRLGVDAVRGTNGGLGDTGGADCDGEGSYIAMSDGSTYNLYIPSGAETGLKLVGGITVPVNGSADFTAEIDLMKSVATPDGLSPDVIFRPTIRLVNNVEAGHLTGMVHPDLVAPENCQPSVYVFDDGVTPNAIDEGDVVDPEDPVATALVNERMNELEELEYHYTVGFLLPGEYEVAFTCDGETFTPEAGQPAPIEANMLTTVDFE